MPKERDPNVPVLAFEIDGRKYEILVAGPDERITCAHNKRYRWSPNSIIIRETDAAGLREHEHDLHSATVWGWLGRLLQDRTTVKLLSKTDR